MTPGQQIVAALRIEGCEQVTLEEDGLRLHFPVQASDRIGCVLPSLTLEDSRLGMGGIREWADRVVAHVGQFLEGLKVYEADVPSAKAILRSQPPYGPRAAAQGYYEVALDCTSGHLTLRRWCKLDIDTERVQRDCNFTFEAFEPLIDGLLAAMRPPAVPAEAPAG